MIHYGTRLWSVLYIQIVIQIHFAMNIDCKFRLWSKFLFQIVE